MAFENARLSASRRESGRSRYEAAPSPSITRGGIAWLNGSPAERCEAPAPISLLEVAVSDKDGFVTFDRRGGAFSGRIVNDETKDGAAAATLEVPSRSLDSLVEDGDTPPPDFIKIDVEGGEGAVLSGARRTLTTHRPEILLEMHHFAKSGVERAYAVLDEQGYRLHLVDNFGGGELPLLTRSERARARHILAVPS